MIDLRRLDDEEYTHGMARKGAPVALVDEVRGLDGRRRELLARVEDLRSRRNAVSREIGAAAPGERPARIATAGALKDELAALEPELAGVEERLAGAAMRLPNPADPSAPSGGEDEGLVLSTVGEPGARPPLDHAELGELLGWVDTRRGARTSGPRFAYLLGRAVLLELALVRLTMDRLAAEGFVPVVPPVLVREATMEAAGFFPTDRHQVYGVGSAESGSGDEDDLFLVGTSEVPLSVLHWDEIVEEDDLPLRYAGLSTCFRREAGTYGRDTRGLFRVHQFDKVEMFSFSHPKRSSDEHERLLAIEESLVAALGLPYRVVSIAAGDLGAPAAKKIDIEVWLPSEGRYRELTSCSNYTDFSARRLQTRFRSGDGNRLVHTLNGTACAVGRTLVFLFEHYQENGSFVVPDALAALCGFDRFDAPAQPD